MCALQVHVAVGSADATLAVYNALRGHLPELAALAANAPFHAGRDTGLRVGAAADRRRCCRARACRRRSRPGRRSRRCCAGDGLGAVPEPRRWWWELRPHVAFGTLELRVLRRADDLAEAAAVAAFAHALVAWLAERHDAGEPLGAPETWRIAENRWVGLPRTASTASFADLETGERRPVREVLRERLEQLAPVAERLGCAAELAGARALAERNGALRQRAVAAERACRLARWLAERLLERLAALLGAARAAEADQVVRAVAERPQARLAAAAERDRLAAGVDLVAVLVERAGTARARAAGRRGRA